MSTAQLAAVSYLARYARRTHVLYAFQLGEWLAWCQINGLDPLAGIQRAYVAPYIRGLGDRGLMDSCLNTMMQAVRGYFRFAHIDGLIPADPGVYARLPKVHREESRTQGLDRLAPSCRRAKRDISRAGQARMTPIMPRSWWSRGCGSGHAGPSIASSKEAAYFNP